ncbi:sacsin N-terminal ATP-binding-like domain-containing protein [Coraliomargarita sp. W4R53]
MPPELSEVEFEQKQPLHIAIKNLIHDYPQDEGILKELIQNADDGGATEIRFILDDAQYGDIDGPSACWSEFGGASLLVVNNQPFRERDLDNIKRLGDSVKIEDSSKTGRYGRGFNAVYNLTDSPLLLTRDFVGYFDPCGFFSDSDKKGRGWNIGDSFHVNHPDALSIFRSAGIEPTDSFFDATIFRFPLRERLRGDLPRDRVSEQSFVPSQFDTLVKGLGRLAPHLLLFLRNVRFIGCYKTIGSTGELEPLLEIRTENEEEVEQGRSVINAILKDRSADEVLEHLEGVTSGLVETQYSHRISVSDGNDRQFSWMVCSGLYSGSEHRLIQLSRKMSKAGDRAIPVAGAAVCVEFDGVPFPEDVDGGVSCFLPLSGIPGASQLPVHLNGAFDLDGSRAGLTRRREGQFDHGLDRVLWNEFLIEDAVSEAYASLVSHCQRELLPHPGDLYSIFPKSDYDYPSPFDAFRDAVYSKLSELPVFRNARKEWVPVAELRLLDEDPDLQRCFVLEALPVADPPLPSFVLRGLEQVDALPSQFSIEEIQAHFSLQDAGDWNLSEHPFPGLRSIARIYALTRYLTRIGPGDWDGLPIALCHDGRVRTFRNETPLFIGSSAQHRIFFDQKHWFLDPDYVDRCGLGFYRVVSFRKMDILEMLSRLSHLTTPVDVDDAIWDSRGESGHNDAWLAQVFSEINSHTLASPGLEEALTEVCIVPADDNQLHLPGKMDTPLLVQLKEKQVCEVLEILSVRYWLLNPNNPITSELTKFRDTFGVVYDLTAWDLVDTLDSQSEELEESLETWQTDKVVNRLLALMADGIDDDAFNDTRIEKLKGLPLFQDSNGDYGPIDETTFLVGHFSPPSDLHQGRLLDSSNHYELYQKLGLRKITRKDVLETLILPTKAEWSGDPDSCVRMMRWIRDEWNHLVEEYEAEASLVSVLSDVACIYSSNGTVCKPKQLYHPSVESLIDKVLGQTANYPDEDLYRHELELWNRFFSQLGLAHSPREQDLVDYIEHVIASVEDQEVVTSKQREGLVAILDHVREHWDLVSQAAVDSELLEESTLSEFLAEAEWVPPAILRDEGDPIGLWEPQGKLLYAPKELLPVSQRRRAESVCEFLPVREFSPMMREALGVRRLPSVEQMCAHLENVVERFGEGPFEPELYKSLLKNLGQIYRGLGELRESLEDDELIEALEARCLEFQHVPCLLIPLSKCFVRPCDVYFGSAPETISPLKHLYRSSDSTVERGFSLLGRMEAPTVADLADALERLAELGNPLEDYLLSAVLASLHLMKRLVDDGQHVESAPRVFVPNAQGQLIEPEELMFNDAPMLLEQLDVDQASLLHQDAPFLIQGVYEVTRLSKVEARTCGELHPSTDSEFIRACDDLQKLIRSPEFLTGLKRIIWGAGMTPRPGELAWLQNASVEAFRSVYCEFLVHIPSGGEQTLGVAMVDVTFDPRKEDGVFLVSEQVGDLLYNQFAAELARQLDEQSPVERSTLVEILKRSPDQIEETLNRLKVGALRSGSFEGDIVEDVQADTAFEYDEEELDDLQGAVADVDALSDGEELVAPPDEEGADLSDEEEEYDELEDLEEDNEGAAPAVSPRGNSASNATRSASTSGASRSTRSGSHSSRGGNRGGRRPYAPDPDKARNPGGSKRRVQNDLWISRPFPEKNSESKPRERDIANDEEPINEKVGNAAVGWVLQYERMQGRKPQNQDHWNKGFDVISKKGRVIDRYIEVKGIDGSWGTNGVPLSNSQLFTFLEPESQDNPSSPLIGDKFWLYVVENALDPEKVHIHMIQNPAQKATQYRFDSGWKAAGESVYNFKALVPKEGMKLIKFDHEGLPVEGEILNVGEGNYLKVRFGQQPASTVVYNPLFMQLAAE